MALLHYVIFATILISRSTCHENNDDYDTIIVGLGAAGTVAASKLARAGKKVLALEAQDRVGGRVYTVPFGDGVVELGAEWIQGTEGSLTYKAATDNNVMILPQELRYQIIRSDGSFADAVVHEILEYAMEYQEEKPNKTEPLADFLTKKLTAYIKEKSPDTFEDEKLLKQILDYAKQSIANEWGACDLNDLRVDEYVDIQGNQYLSWHRNGYKTFFDIMLNKYKEGPGLPALDIKLNTEVTKIDWPQEAEGKVKVTTKDGTVYSSENVIITVSIGILKEKYRIVFSPTLPQKKVTAIEKVQMGLIGKIIFSFANAWWPNKDRMYGFLWNEDDLTKIALTDNWTTKLCHVSTPMGSTNTITVWTSGYVTKQVEIMTEDEVKAKTMAILRRFMGNNITIPEPTGMLRTKWFLNEFTRGTYSYDNLASADFPSARSELAAPVLDAAGKLRVLFAGEATNPTHFATVHGAAETGHREANRLLGQH